MGRKSNKDKKKELKQPRVHPELVGYNVTINEFGEIVSSFKVDRLNEFLNQHLPDKKFKTPLEQKSNDQNLDEENVSEENRDIIEKPNKKNTTVKQK